jgi:hypothetical protein
MTMMLFSVKQAETASENGFLNPDVRVHLGSTQAPAD